MKNIVLIGFMGTGKTVVGRRLSQRLGLDFIDTDTEVERVTGKTIPQIFAQDGETRFRSEERLAVKRVASRENLVVATGGGVVLNPENVADLKKNGVLICLTADPQVIYQRVNHKRNRPLLAQSKDLRQRIEELQAERAQAYQVAELTLDTSYCTPDEIADKIISYLSEKDYQSSGMDK